jgi:hypothetical protein
MRYILLSFGLNSDPQSQHCVKWDDLAHHVLGRLDYARLGFAVVNQTVRCAKHVISMCASPTNSLTETIIIERHYLPIRVKHAEPSDGNARENRKRHIHSDDYRCIPHVCGPLNDFTGKRHNNRLRAS